MNYSYRLCHFGLLIFAEFFIFIIQGRVNSSAVVSELIYSLSNLLILFNDRIIERSKCGILAEEQSKYKLKLMLTTLEYSEVFIELSAKKVWGERGRWFFITIVQLLKCFGRMILRFRHRESITQNPPIAMLDRKNVDNLLAEASANRNVPGSYDPNCTRVTFTLKRSGRVVRKIEGSPPVYMRTWKSLSGEEQETNSNLTEIAGIARAEILYILKPLIHLSSISMFGSRSWKSYGVALFIDLLSLQMYRKNMTSLTQKQRLELSRRTVAMLLYLMRTPFYEKFTQRKLNSLLDAVAATIPFSKSICQPIADYIPHWQQTYFYMWSS